MLVLLATLATTLLRPCLAADDNSDLVFPPPPSSASGGEERLLILIPGANVATSFYKQTAESIQRASNHTKLWVVVPAMPTKKCILLCPSVGFCAPLQARVQEAAEKAKEMGFEQNTKGPAVFMAGHSLGGTCASTLTSAYAKSNEGYGALVVMGSYVTDQNVLDFPVPVFTLGAALDGGLGRPGMLLRSMQSSLLAEKSTNMSWYVRNKPVAIIEGIDHSSFCPGFRVPGDVWPAEVDGETGSRRIGELVAAFLDLQLDMLFKADGGERLLTVATKFTHDDLLKPYVDALSLEYSEHYESAPWCAESQILLAGLLEEKDISRVHIASASYFNDSHQFEHSRVHYENSSGVLELNISGHNDKYSGGVLDLVDSCLVPAHDVACKLASADRVAQQLGIGSPGTKYVANRTCRDLSQAAIERAFDLLRKTPAGRRAVELHSRRGRPFCLLPDGHAFGNIGPLFVSETIKIADNGTCLGVQSLTLGPQPLNSKIFPGVHYCKSLSPARALDYIMTDSLKPKSGCLNT
eukprot:g2003.t1